MGLQGGRRGIDGEIEKQTIAAPLKLFTDFSIQKRTKVLGPQHDAVDLVGPGGDLAPATVIGVFDLEGAPVDIGGVEGRGRRGEIQAPDAGVR